MKKFLIISNIIFLFIVIFQYYIECGTWDMYKRVAASEDRYRDEYNEYFEKYYIALSTIERMKSNQDNR